jgi:putative endonuclease
MSQWYVYMLRCADGTYYTGVTTDITRRIREHNGEVGGALGAKYTKARRPVSLVYEEMAMGRSEAQQREAAIRRLSRGEKEELAKMTLKT